MTRGEQRRNAPVSLALVQHAHQHLITDGYDNREGIGQIVDAFTAVLALHLRYRVPLNLHASGMLLEAIAWHRPDFFAWIAALRRERLLEVIGSAYAQNIMPLFDARHNARQLVEALEGYERLLGVPPSCVRGFWVPERVWDTARVASAIADASLPNGGYRYVLLDDRLALPAAGARARFDAAAPAATGGRGSASAVPTRADQLHAFAIAGSGGLAALPISVDLRYSVPPRADEQWSRIRAALRATSRAGPGAIAVFADDLERSAAVGPWTDGAWRRDGVAPYERFLRWIAREARLHPVLLSDWLARHPPRDERPVDPGTYFELAYAMKAGERYDCWWNAPAWAPYRQMLVDAERALVGVGANHPRGGLVDLAWKQLMAASFETAWHDVGPDGAPHPAPWARACASHARGVHATLHAARWLAGRDGAAHAEEHDVDRDGDAEVVLKNDHVVAVVAPRHGGRLVALYDLRTPGGRQLIGNPADDWNWQEELNQYMRAPRNHPGACAEVGHEGDRWEVQAIRSAGDVAEVVLVDVQRDSALCGARKRFRVRAGRGAVDVAYRLPTRPERLRIEIALSPDYLALLRDGRASLRRIRGKRRRGWSNGDAAVWVALRRDDPTRWDVPPASECGHGKVLCLAACGRRFALRIGTGP